MYKRRGEAKPELGAPPPRPRRLHFVLDISGSMYRFNSQDGRLNRMLEAAVLIMEGFRGFETKCVAVCVHRRRHADSVVVLAEQV